MDSNTRRRYSPPLEWLETGCRRFCMAIARLEAGLALPAERNFNIAVLAAYVLVAGTTMLGHEMFRDEIQAWLIARDSSSVADLVRNLRYENQPALWYLLLMPLTRVSRNPVLMQGLQFALASTAVAVVLWRAPLTRLERLLFPFGFYILFEFGVKSRSYMLGFLIVALFCALWQRRRDHPLIMAGLLGALANVHAICVILSAGAACALIVDRMTADAVRPAARRFDWRQDIPAIFILGLGWVLSAVVGLPPSDEGFAPRWYFNLYLNHLTGSLRALGALLGSEGWLVVVASIVIFSFLIRRRRNCPVAATLLFVSVGGCLALFYAKYAGLIWDHGFIYVAFLAAVWIERAQSKALAAAPTRAGLFVPPAVLVMVLIVQAWFGLVATMRDLARPYSNAYAVARFIRAQGWQDEPIAGIPDESASAVLGYLEADRIYYAKTQRWGSFVIWDRKWLSPIDDAAVIQGIDALGPHVTVVASWFDVSQLQAYGFRVVRRFTGSVIGEDYTIYRRGP